MNELELQKSLEKIYSASEDSHNIYTPISLCKDMINSISDLNGDILVISNIEFLFVLKDKGVDLNNVYYTVNCELKKTIANGLGIKSNNISNLEYNNKEIKFNIDMKFDVIIQNPPYNPNSLWKKFVLKGIDLLKEDGQMVAIHPDSWRKKTSHKKLFNHLKEHISELHINEFNAFPGVAISTDWYVYNKQKCENIEIHYNNGDVETVDNDIKRIYSFSQTSIPSTIINKITKNNYDNNIIIKDTGYYELEHISDGKYKQCGGRGNGTGWTKGDFVLTNKPTEHQFENKVVMAYHILEK